MKKIYYISYLDNWGTGINSKINLHLNIFKKNGFEVEYIRISKGFKGIKKYIYRILPFFTENNYQLLEKIEENSYIYIRSGLMDYRGYKSLIALKKKGCKIIIEIPTFPYDDEVKGIFKLFLYKDKLWRRKYKNCIDRIVTYSNDEYIFNVKSIRISNFINHSDIHIKKNTFKYDEIHLIAVATLAYWHGYDRIIEGLRNYYMKNTKCKVYLHLVGDGNVLNKYNDYINKYNLEKYVFLYGRKVDKDLNDIYDKADIAIDSLGRHRSNIYYNSTLKGKEYLAKGIPIVSGVKTELDECSDFKYYLRVPADETPINIDDIVSFYYTTVYPHKNSIIDYIREYSLHHFYSENCFNPVIEYYMEE